MEAEKHKQGEASPRSGNVLSKGWNWYEDTVSGWVAAMARANGRLGVVIVRSPVWTLILSLLLVGLCAGGWARFRLVNDSDQLWVPRVSKARTDKTWVQAHYASSDNGVQLLTSLQPQWRTADGPFGGDNVIQLAVTWEIFQVDAAIRALSVTWEGAAYAFSDLCLRSATTGTCRNYGYLNYWSMDFDTYLSNVTGSRTDRTAGNRTQLMENVNMATLPDGSYPVSIAVFAPLVLNAVPQITGAQVIAMGYSIDNAIPLELANLWFNAYVKLMKTAVTTLHLQYTEFNFIATNSVGLEIQRSIQKDMKLVIASVIVFFVVGIIGVSRWDWVRTRSSLALVGVAGAALAIVAGYGLSMLMYQAFTTLDTVLPYILLGVTVDVMFIMVKGFDEIVAKEPHLDLEQRFFKLMAGPGFSCAVVLLASSVAFSLGATSVLPATTWFSVFATLGTVAILVVQSTFFIAVFVLNEKRIAARRRDCCCCSVVGGGGSGGLGSGRVQPAPEESGGSGGRLTAPLAMAIDMPDKGSEASATGSNNLFKVLFEKYYAPFLLRWPVRIAVLVIFAALCIVCGLAIPHLQRGQPIRDLAPNDSYLIPYDKITTDTFGFQEGDPMLLYFRGIDISQPATQGAMLRTLATVLDNPYVNTTLSSFESNWLLAFISWVGTNSTASITSAGGCSNPYVGATSGRLAQYVDPQPLLGCVAAAPFYILFNQWLRLPGNSGMSAQFVKTRVAGSSPPFYTVTANRFAVVETAAKGVGSYNGDSIKSLRQLEVDVNRDLFSAANAGLPSGSLVFLLYGQGFIFAEGDAVLSEMAMEYLVVALCGVGVVMLFMLVNPVAVLTMMVAVGMVDLILFGLMWAASIRFNQVSVINTIMATGLSVDYSVYWAQKFMTTVADGTRAGRVTQALAETGSAVFLGGLTALLGSLPLAFSSSTILKTFWKLLWGTIISALLIGLVLVPVVFSIIGPPPLRRLALALDTVDGDDGSSERAAPLLLLTDVKGAGVGEGAKSSAQAAGESVTAENRVQPF